MRAHIGILLLAGVVYAQRVQPDFAPTLSGTAGQTLSRGWTGEGQRRIKSIVEIRTVPDLKEPLRADFDDLSAKPTIRLTIPPSTPEGTYSVEIRALSEDGQTTTDRFSVRVNGIQLPRSAVGRVPVILLNGFQVICTNRGSALTDSESTFGKLASLLQADQVPVAFFNNCAYDDIPIEQLGRALGDYLSNLRYADGTPIPQFDLVAHSMGGLIARSHLAGIQSDGTASPPTNHKTRKLVFLATPNFGSFQSAKAAGDVQAREMILGSAFLWNLASWNQGRDDLRGADALSIVGNAGSWYSPGGLDDGVVSLTSASLGFASSEDRRTRIVPYCHSTPGFFTGLGMTCSGPRGIADIDTSAHLTARIVRAFLADEATWTTIGASPSQDPWLSKYGGMYFAYQTAAGQWITDLTRASFGSVPLSIGGVSGSAPTGTIFYHEFVNGTGPFQATSASLGLLLACGPFAEPVGRYSVYRCWQPPPTISLSPTQLQFAHTVGVTPPPSQSITVANSGSGSFTWSVAANASWLSLSSAPGILSVAVNPNGLSPNTYQGTITITASLASNSPQAVPVTLVVTPATSTVVVTSVTNAASGGSGPIAPGEMITIKGIGLGPAAGVSFSVNSTTGMLDSALAGARVFLGSVPAPLTYVSATQINAIVPYEIPAPGQATLQVSYQGQISAGTTVQMGNAAPAVFTFNSTGSGQAVAANEDGTFNGPATPAAKGSYVTVYFTGGGRTAPAGGTGSVNPTTLKYLTQDVSVSVGGQAALVAFAGAAPTFVDGVGQLNIRLADNTPSGTALPLVLRVGGVASPASGTLAVR